MTKLKLFSTYCIMAVFTLFFAACSKDDESDEPYDASNDFNSELIGTWEMDETTSITFNSDGSGEIKTSDFELPDDEDDDDETYSYKMMAKAKTAVATKTDDNTIQCIPFNWIYNNNPPQIKLTIQKTTFVWYIESLYEGILIIRDSDGNTFSMRKSTGSTPVPTTGIIGSKELLYGDWGSRGYQMLRFTENGRFTILYYKEKPTAYYSYDENNHIINIYGGGDGLENCSYKLTNLTSTVIGLTIGTGKDQRHLYLSRINENENNTIDALSLIYDKKLTATGILSMNDEPVTMTMTIKSNGKCIMTVNSDVQIYDYEYNESTHLMSLSRYGSVQHFTVIKLTENGIILKKYPQNPNENEYSSLMEYMVI